MPQKTHFAKFSVWTISLRTWQNTENIGYKDLDDCITHNSIYAYIPLVCLYTTSQKLLSYVSFLNMSTNNSFVGHLNIQQYP